MDLIGRQDTIDAIEQHKTAVLEGLEVDEGIAYGYAAAHRHLVEIVKRLPSAQPEIIRCKDCMYWRRDRISCEGYAMCQTGEGGIRFRRENDYCSVARRRTDE